MKAEAKEAPKSSGKELAATDITKDAPSEPTKETVKAGAKDAKDAKDAPSPAQTSPAPYATDAKPGLDMEWDDEEEATHVLPEKDGKEPTTTPRGERPAAGTPGGARVPAPPGAAAAAPPPPPPTMPGIGFRPLSSPPPNALGGFARASANPAPPPPPGAMPNGMPVGPMSGGPLPPPPPPGTSTAPMAPMGGPVPPGMSAPPSPTQGQVHTAPMPMPSRQPVPAAPQATRAMEQTAMVRPPPSRTGLFVGLGLLVLVAVGGVLAFAIPRTGTLRVNATDGKGASLARVEIFVDGRKVCDTSPCIVEQLSPGAHAVKALVGTDAVDKSAVVEARSEATLEIAVSGSSTVAAPAKGTGIKISSAATGAKLAIDGKDIGALPQEVRDLTPGDHKVRVTAGDRYEAFDKTVTVAKDEMLSLDNVVLKVLKGKATITLGTPGAKVTLVSGSVRKDIPTFPISVDIDTAQSWTLEAAKNGFVDFKMPISFADGQAEKTIHVELESKGSMSSSSSSGRDRTNEKPAEKPAEKPEKPVVAKPEKPAEKPAEKPEKPAVAAGEGTLDMNSIPASSVLLDGKPIGNTPRVKVPVSAGNHTVTFLNSEQGLKKVVQVTVGAGESKKVIQKLRE